MNHRRPNGPSGRGARFALCDRARLLVVAIITLWAGAPAHAVQHLVRPGDSWDALAPRLQPGDEIILMPGRHLPGLFDDLHGTADQPITIRGVDAEHPAVIVAHREGIRLRGAQHIVIRDLAITGATISGIAISDGRDIGDGRERASTNITIRNATVERTGPRGLRHGIQLSGVNDVKLERVRIEGWGGSAVEVVGCNSVEIERCMLIGRNDHGQLNGVQIRAGSENVRITRTLFADTGEAGVVLGGSSQRRDFRNRPLGEEELEGWATPLHETRNIAIERCLFQRGESAIAFLSVDQSRVRNNTILQPTRWVYFVAPASRQNPRRSAGVRQSTFGFNLIVWNPGELQALSHLEPPAAADGLTIEQNLWWGGEDEESRSRLGAPVGQLKSSQVMDVDPDLDERLRPRTRRAQLFGPDGP